MMGKHKSMWSGQLGEIVTTKHRIELNPGSVPKNQMTYRQRFSMWYVTSKKILQQLYSGVIKPSSSNWDSPVVFVPKKYVSVLFCADYRRLDEAEVRDTYPLR